MQDKQTFILDKNGVRLDFALSQNIACLSRAKARVLCESGFVLVNEEIVKKFGKICSKGDVVSVCCSVSPIVARSTKQNQEFELDIIDQDDYLLILNKPRNVHCVTLSDNDPLTIADAIVNKYPECFNASSDKREGGLVQRLDFFTSGIIIAARSKEIWKKIHLNPFRSA